LLLVAAVVVGLAAPMPLAAAQAAEAAGDDAEPLWRRLLDDADGDTDRMLLGLHGLAESLQYTIYHGAEGGHFDWHRDQGDAHEEPRKISLSLQLSDGSSYEGCALELHSSGGVQAAPRKRGTLIAFPSYVLHRVTPIRSGIRKSLVVWAAGPEFR
jgi:PKHD-type hydroxylase